MIYNASAPVLGLDSFTVARDTLENLASFTELLQQTHFDNRAILDPAYLSLFDAYFFGSLCGNGSTNIQLQYVPFDCNAYQYSVQVIPTSLNIIVVGNANNPV